MSQFVWNSFKILRYYKYLVEFPLVIFTVEWIYHIVKKTDRKKFHQGITGELHGFEKIALGAGVLAFFIFLLFSPVIQQLTGVESLYLTETDSCFNCYLEIEDEMIPAQLYINEGGRVEIRHVFIDGNVYDCDEEYVPETGKGELELYDDNGFDSFTLSYELTNKSANYAVPKEYRKNLDGWEIARFAVGIFIFAIGLHVVWEVKKISQNNKSVEETY